MPAEGIQVGETANDPDAVSMQGNALAGRRITQIQLNVDLAVGATRCG